jgi:hypothetical protein
MEEKKIIKRIIEKQIKREEYLYWISFSKTDNNAYNGILFDTNEDNI